MMVHRGSPSPPSALSRGVGEGGSPRSGETGEGALPMITIFQQPPHPARPGRRKSVASAGPPSPAGGEGPHAAGVVQNRKSVSPQIKTKRARMLRRSMTDAERKLWFALRGRRFQDHKFRRQVPVGPFIADFIAFQPRLIVEVDGGQHADSSSDKARDAWMRDNGFSVVRYWNNDVLKNLDGVLDDLWRRLTPAGEP